MRAWLSYVGWKERKAVAADLKHIYPAPTREEGEQGLEEFAIKWESRYQMISKQWRANRERLAVFFAYPAEIRKVIYTTNAIESVNKGGERSDQETRVVPEQRGGAEVDISGAAKSEREMDNVGERQAGGAEPTGDSL